MTVPDAPIDLSPAALAAIVGIEQRVDMGLGDGRGDRADTMWLIALVRTLAADKDNALRLLETASDKVRELEQAVANADNKAFAGLRSRIATLEAKGDRLRADALTAEDIEHILVALGDSMGCARCGGIKSRLQRIAQRPESP